MRPKPEIRNPKFETRRTFLRRGTLFVPAIFIPRLIRAQTILTAPGLASFKKKVSSGGGGGGGYTLIAHTSTSGTGSGNQTTGNLNTIGASLIVACVAQYRNGSTSITLVDNLSNSYSALTKYGYAAFDRNYLQFFYCLNPTVGGTHNWTGGDSGNYVALSVLVFSGGTPAYDVSNGNNSDWTGTTITSGSITTTAADLVIAACSGGKIGETISADSGMGSAIETATSDGSLLELFYKNQSSAGSINVTFTSSAGTDGAAGICAFK